MCINQFLHSRLYILATVCHLNWKKGGQTTPTIDELQASQVTLPLLVWTSDYYAVFWNSQTVFFCFIRDSWAERLWNRLHSSRTYHLDLFSDHPSDVLLSLALICGGWRGNLTAVRSRWRSASPASAQSWEEREGRSMSRSLLPLTAGLLQQDSRLRRPSQITLSSEPDHMVCLENQWHDTMTFDLTSSL